jgi:peptide-methionine (S)-S-oxide reductase
MHTETATFAAGCFWGVEAAFRQVPGVVATRVGFTGGTTQNPTYKQVCTGRTGHAEAVQVTFDPERVSYDELLDAFWDEHNPTSRNRQGFDIGYQYRSAIFFHSAEQAAAARASRDAVQEQLRWPWQKVVTAIEPASAFWPAEEYHQRYLEKMGRATCTAELRGRAPDVVRAT